MTQENKDLLLKDLCARLPYGVKVEIYKDEPPYNIKGYDGKDFLSDSGWDYLIEQCKPYLFPLSSMNEEQKEEFNINEKFESLVDIYYFFKKYKLMYRLSLDKFDLKFFRLNSLKSNISVYSF